MTQIILELLGLFAWAILAPSLFFSFELKRWQSMALVGIYIFITEVIIYFTLLQDTL